MLRHLRIKYIFNILRILQTREPIYIRDCQLSIGATKGILGGLSPPKKCIIAPPQIIVQNNK